MSAFQAFKTCLVQKGRQPLERRLNPTLVFQTHLYPPAQESARTGSGSQQPAVRDVGHTSAEAGFSPLFRSTGTHRLELLRASARFLLLAANLDFFSPVHQSRVICKGHGWLDKTRYLPSRKHKTLISLHNPIITRDQDWKPQIHSSSQRRLAWPLAGVHRASEDHHSPHRETVALS